MTIEFFSVQSHEYTQARRHHRLPVDFNVHVRSPKLRLSDRACDLSEGGLGVETDEPLSLMELVSLRLECPHLAEPVDVLGRVIWTGARRMGIRFEQVDPRLHDALDRLRQDFERI